MVRKSVSELLVLISLIAIILPNSRAQNNAPLKQDSALPRPGAITADPSVKAGDSITFHIEFDRSINVQRAYLNVNATGPGGLGVGNSVALEPGKTSYDVQVPIPFDAPGGTYRLTQVTVATVTGMHSSTLKVESVSFQVIQTGKFDLPTAAKVSINLSQSQLLWREAANLQNKIQVLKAAISALPEGKHDVRVATILRQNVLDADKALEKTESEFLKLISTQSQEPTANIFFGDLHVTYRQALDRIGASSSWSPPDFAPRIQNVGQGARYPVLAEAVFRAFEQNELAYKVVADTGSLTFDLEVDTVPQGADVSYRRRGDSFAHLQNTTNSTIRSLPYAIWFVRFEKSGFRTEDREHDPFHEQNHVVNVELQPEKKNIAK